MERGIESSPADSESSGHVLVEPRRAAPRKRHLWLRAFATFGALVLISLVALFAISQNLNRNLKAVTLPAEVQQGSASADSIDGIAAGEALNVVVLGSDSRNSTRDCKLGGSCDASASSQTSSGTSATDGANADVQMVVHISADRSNATVLSIPRDTMMTVPACSGNGLSQSPHFDRINSTLSFGPACTITAIHELTGLAIHHFVMVDFSGVVSLSDAIGGVEVCTSDDVYDPYSHLKLTKGQHTLQGLSALQFLRTRHGFGDGSDIGRTVAQHIFLSSMQRKLESAGTLLNPNTMYHLAATATRVLTVDTGLASVTSLAQLGVTLSRIPSNRTTFITMPTVPNPNNSATVIPASSAAGVFEKMAKDISFTKAPEAAANSSATSSSATSSNATGSSPASATNGASASGKATESSSKASKSASATTSSASQTAEDYQQTSATNTGCAQVSKEYTVQINGVGMTPTQAFAASPRVPLSAP